VNSRKLVFNSLKTGRLEDWSSKTLATA